MLALIAGRGELPGVLVGCLKNRPYIAALEGFDPENLVPDRRFRLEHLGSLIRELKSLGVTEVCFAGAISRPEIDPAKIDETTRYLFASVAQALTSGDDGALRIILSIFQDAGFRIRAANEIASSLQPKAAVYSARQPDQRSSSDAQRAAQIIGGMGPLDVGQSCAVKLGQALAIEGVFGTDWMLASLCGRPDGNGGVFFKAKKPGQDLRVDIPVIGTQTVAGVAKAGLDGLVIEAGGVMILDLPGVTREADDAGLFLWVREP